MLTLKQYEELQTKALKCVDTTNNKQVKEMIGDIDSINDLIYLCSKNIMPHGTMQYKIKSLKAKYNEQLNNIVHTYHQIIFPDLDFNTDFNNIVGGPTSLKIWLTRYICNYLNHDNLEAYLNEDFYSMNVTEQYQLIDVILFNQIINKKQFII